MLELLSGPKQMARNAGGMLLLLSLSAASTSEGDAPWNLPDPEVIVSPAYLPTCFIAIALSTGSFA